MNFNPASIVKRLDQLEEVINEQLVLAKTLIEIVETHRALLGLAACENCGYHQCGIHFDKCNTVRHG